MEIQNIVNEVERRVSQKADEIIIFEGDPAWKLIFAGPVASTISQKYEKPVFLYKKMDKESCGSVRNPKGTHSVDAMKSCKEFLVSYGGHAQASGFRLKNENLENFKTCLIEYFKK
jgi:single-stranded-DNA-specific exonuclease